MCGKSIPLFSLVLALSIGISVTNGQVDYLTEEFRGDAYGDGFDLAYSSITFTPTSDRTSYVYSKQKITHLPTDPSVGTDLGLSDDDCIRVTFEHYVYARIFDHSFPHIYVGSNGYVVFTQYDWNSSQTLEEHFRILRISGLNCDLNPPYSRSVRAQYCINRIAITWQDVPEFGHTATNTFQIEIFYDGKIRLSWLEINTDACIVGLSNGDGLPWGFEETNFSDEPLQATEPDPAHGARHFDTWATLSWRPGSTAVRHDVYVGSSYSSVYNARKYNGTSAFIRTQVDSTMTLGFPGYPYPDGLVPGMTYYWRIDEVEADGTTHRGSVWNFTVQEYVSVPILEEEQTIRQSQEVRIVDMRRDLTVGGLAKDLVVDFQGNPNAIPAPIYVKIKDSTGAFVTIIHPNPSVSQIADKIVWRIDLNEIADAGVDPTDVEEIYFGSGPGEPIPTSPVKVTLNEMKIDSGFQTVKLNITVIVKDSNSQYIKGATVSVDKVINNVEEPHDALKNRRKETDDYGHVEAKPHCNYPYRIVVKMSGYKTHEEEREFEPVITGIINWKIELEPIGGGSNGADNGADNWEDATPIGNVTNQEFDTTHATNDGYDNSIEGPNIWYCYTATCDGTVTVSLCGSSFDTRLDIYDDCDTPPRYETAIPDAWNDDFCGRQSQSTFVAIKDHKYLIEVGGYADHAGPGLISIWCGE